MDTLIFIVILMVCIAIVGFIFKNIFPIIGTIVVFILIKMVYSYFKNLYYKGKTTLNEKKYKKKLEDIKNNTGKVSYVDAEVVKVDSINLNDKTKKDNLNNYVDVDYKDID